jgi:hypothetical protein
MRAAHNSLLRQKQKVVFNPYLTRTYKKKSLTLGKRMREYAVILYCADVTEKNILQNTLQLLLHIYIANK